MIFSTPRLLVRQFEMSDAPVFHRLNSDEEVIRYIRPPKTREESDHFLKEAIEAYNAPAINQRLAIVNNTSNQVIGTFAIIPLPDSQQLQMGYAFLEQYWGLGYATEVVAGGLPYIFEILQLKKIVAVTEIANIASKKVLLKNGFTQLHNYFEKGKEVTLYEKEKK